MMAIPFRGIFIYLNFNCVIHVMHWFLCVCFCRCCESWYHYCKFPADTLRKNDVVITSKRRHCDVITSQWRRFDVITTSLLRHVFRGFCQWSTCFAYIAILVTLIQVVWTGFPKTEVFVLVENSLFGNIIHCVLILRVIRYLVSRQSFWMMSSFQM